MIIGRSSQILRKVCFKPEVHSNASFCGIYQCLKILVIT